MSRVRVLLPKEGDAYGVPYYQYRSVAFIDRDDIKDPEVRAKFDEWLHGATLPYLTFCKSPAYISDWFRFNAGLLNND